MAEISTRSKPSPKSSVRRSPTRVVTRPAKPARSMWPCAMSNTSGRSSTSARSSAGGRLQMHLFRSGSPANAVEPLLAGELLTRCRYGTLLVVTLVGPLAVLADVHGTRWALEAVLEDADRAGAQRFIDLGDCVAGPLDPCGTARRLMALDAVTVLGNHDRALLEGEPHRLECTPSFAGRLARCRRDTARRSGRSRSGCSGSIRGIIRRSGRRSGRSQAGWG